MKRLAITLSAVLLTACASLPDQEVMQSETLSLLDGEVEVIIDDAPIENAREKALKSYQALLDGAPNSDTQPEIIRRIADLQVEKGESIPLPESDDPAQIVQYQETVDQHYATAAGYYQRLLSEYPNDESTPDVYYQLAKAYEHQGSPEEILNTLNQLAEKHPGLETIDEVHFRRGELMFSLRDMSGAQKAYAKVIAIGEESAYYERSLYKRGWALFKQNRYEASIVQFVQLFDLTLPEDQEGYFQLQKKNRADRELLGDALRAVSLNMSYLDGAKSISEYFSGDNQRVYDDLIYGSLGAYYIEKERFADAAASELEFVKQHGSSPQAPLFQHRAIKAYQQADFPEKVLQGKRDYVLLYETHSQQWNITDATLNTEVQTQLKSYITELAKHSHALAQAEKKASTRQAYYREAVQWYRKYLVHFGSASDAPVMHFLMAEALFENQQYREATIEYEQVAYKYARHKQSGEAGYAALLAYDKHQQRLPALPSREQMIAAQNQTNNTDNVQESEALRWKRAGIASTRYFADQFPRHKHANTVLTRAANDLYALVELPETVEVATKLINKRPPATAKLRFSAWSVLAHAEYEQQRYPQSEKAYQQVLTFLKKNDQRRPGFVELLAASIYRQGEISRDQGDVAGAVGHFMRVGKAAPESPVRISAEYDAASVVFAAKQWPRAITLLKSFRSRYPGHQLQGDVTQNLAVAYLNSGDKRNAANEFTRLGKESNNPQFQREATLQAAELYEESEDAKAAIAAYTDYIVRYPEPFTEAMEYRQKVVDLYTGLNDSKNVQKWHQTIVAVEAKGGKNRTARTRYIAAHAQLKLAEPTMRAYRAIKLRVPLKDSLAKKKATMQNALKMYKDAATYGVQDVSTASTYYTAEIYRDLSEALLNSERPQGLSELEMEQYDILLEDEAFPFEEQAIEVHEINIARLPKGVYDDWVKRSLQKLAEILPARYNKTERAEPFLEAVE